MSEGGGGGQRGGGGVSKYPLYRQQAVGRGGWGGGDTACLDCVIIEVLFYYKVYYPDWESGSQSRLFCYQRQSFLWNKGCFAYCNIIDFDHLTW